MTRQTVWRLSRAGHLTAELTPYGALFDPEEIERFAKAQRGRELLLDRKLEVDGDAEGLVFGDPMAVPSPTRASAIARCARGGTAVSSRSGFMRRRSAPT